MPSVTPQVGSWYKELQQGLIFEVVAMDDKDATVEAQLLDGELCEYDMDSWDELVLENIEEPEDWRNPFELDTDDRRMADDVSGDWDDDPLNTLEPEVINGLIDDF